jgi:hypothetical protein
MLRYAAVDDMRGREMQEIAKKRGGVFTQDLAVSRREIARWKRSQRPLGPQCIWHILAPTGHTFRSPPQKIGDHHRRSYRSTSVHLDNPQRPAGNQNLPTYDACDERSRSGPIGRLVEWRYGA